MQLVPRSFREYIRIACTMPPNLLLQKALNKVRRWSEFYRLYHNDQVQTSFAVDMSGKETVRLNQFLGNLVTENINKNMFEYLPVISRHYLSHCFDLLGSGWVHVNHGKHYRGLAGYRFDMGSLVDADRNGRWLEGRINSANLEEAQRIWRLVDEDYRPIDWHVDFISGYRWKEDIWYRKIEYGHKIGVDIKVPWELARMQHLPQLAWAYLFALRGEPGYFGPERYVREFRNQVLDFIATNPPRWGVNWNSTMDVAIRVSNWLVAYDLFRSFGACFDENFEMCLGRSVWEHGRHIVNNLEWYSGLRGNHYLSDIVGLLFVSAYLPCNEETNVWLALGIQELIGEVKLQFYEDGSNFEASTSYHRLSAEMVLYATALVLGLPNEKRQVLGNYDYQLIKGPPGLEPAPWTLYPLPNGSDESPFPGWYFSKLERMGEFAMHITRPDGQIPQIGDNDNGRFLRLLPKYKKMKVEEAKRIYQNLEEYNELSPESIIYIEDVLDHRHLVAALNGIFNRADFKSFSGENAGYESEVVSALSKFTVFSSINEGLKKIETYKVQIGDQSNWQKYHALLKECKSPPVEYKFSVLGTSLLDNLHRIAYPDFGLFIFRSDRLYLAVRCGPVGQNGRGGHDHNDQLSAELMIDGKPILIDPGTYNYTALPDARNQYRSANVHFSPHVEGKEPGVLSKDLFFIGGNPRSEVLYFGLLGFLGRHNGYGSSVYRWIQLDNHAIVITDFSPDLCLTTSLPRPILFSPAYGQIIKKMGIDENRTD